MKIEELKQLFKKQTIFGEGYRYNTFGLYKGENKEFLMLSPAMAQTIMALHDLAMMYYESPSVDEKNISFQILEIIDKGLDNYERKN